MLPHILLLQHDVPGPDWLGAALRAAGATEWTVEPVGSCSEAVERLGGGTVGGALPAGYPSAVVVSLFQPDGEGVDAFERLFRAAPHVPKLVVGPASREDAAKQAVQMGARGYLLAEEINPRALNESLTDMLGRAGDADALLVAQERAQGMLDAIGDAILCADAHSRVTYLNAVAEALTGWSNDEAAGQLSQVVLKIVDAATGESPRNAMELASRENRAVGAIPNCTLVRRDGSEVAIEDSAAPIRNKQGRAVGAVMVLRDVSVARSQSHRMWHLAQHDSLTDLPNRNLFDDRMQQAIALAARNGRELAVYYVDLDGFKAINDSLGHAVGDRVLQGVAQRLLRCVRSSDTVSRYGGDEFVLLLPEVESSADAGIVAKRILASLGRIHQIDQHALHVTASVGVALYPADGATADALLKHADRAMYAAKRCGGNRYRVAGASRKLRLVDQPSIEARLAARM